MRRIWRRSWALSDRRKKIQQRGLRRFDQWGGRKTACDVSASRGDKKDVVNNCYLFLRDSSIFIDRKVSIHLALGMFLVTFFFFSTMSCSLWDLSSPSRDWTLVPCMGRRILHRWATSSLVSTWLSLPLSVSSLGAGIASWSVCLARSAVPSAYGQCKLIPLFVRSENWAVSVFPFFFPSLPIFLHHYLLKGKLPWGQDKD